MSLCWKNGLKLFQRRRGQELLISGGLLVASSASPHRRGLCSSVSWFQGSHKQMHCFALFCIIYDILFFLMLFYVYFILFYAILCCFILLFYVYFILFYVYFILRCFILFYVILCLFYFFYVTLCLFYFICFILFACSL